MLKLITLALLLFGGSTALAASAANGKKLFTEHACNSCHAIGTEGSATIGPNLAGVTQLRDADWLKRWLKNPDSMRSDPKILALKAKYPSDMPNLGLSDSDVQDLLAYLATFKGVPTGKSSK